MANNLERVLRLMAEKGASDVYMSANMPIQIKINGQILHVSDQLLGQNQTRQLLAELLPPQQLEDLDDTGELNVGISVPKVGSFRLSAFKQRGSIAAVIRCIPVGIPSLDSLGVPPMLSQLVMEKRGLILMVGATGMQRITAAMLPRCLKADSRKLPTLATLMPTFSSPVSTRSSSCCGASISASSCRVWCWPSNWSETCRICPLILIWMGMLADR